MLATPRIIACLLVLLVGWSGSSLSWAQNLQIVNFDFGNGDTYVGDDGVLSSPDGTFWNRVEIGDGPSGGVFSDNPMRDEFGQPFENPFWGVRGLFLTDTGSPITRPLPGPLSDGINLGNLSELLAFSVLTPEVPFDLVVYFSDASMLSFFEFLSGNFVNAGSVQGPTGAFPGTEGFDYLLFQGLVATPTTIGFPELPGFALAASNGGEANIAAVQIRGQFGVPEPSSLALISLALLGVFGNRRTR